MRFGAPSAVRAPVLHVHSEHGLQCRREGGNLIKIDGAAPASSKNFPFFIGWSAEKANLFRPNNSLSIRLVRQRLFTTIDMYKRLQVFGFRYHGWYGPPRFYRYPTYALTGYQNGGIVIFDLYNLGFQLFHRLPPPRLIDGGRAEEAVAAGEMHDVCTSSKRWKLLQDLRAVKRFGHIIIGAHLHCLNRALDGSKGCNHNDGQVPAVLPSDFLKRFKNPLQARHTYIENRGMAGWR